MAAQLDTVIRFIRRLASAQRGDDADGQLLDRFISQQDEGAFEVLMNRYGGLVLSVCREVLQDQHDVEDAFQATFLVLVRKARSIRKSTALRSWLHGVAYRTAVRAKTNRRKRLSHERQGMDMETAPSPQTVDWRQLGPPLHEELQRLPDKYRLPLLLCYYEKKTYEEAARELGWPLGTLKKRLTDGRELLRKGLARHGVTLSAGVFMAALTERAVSAAVPLALMKTTLKAALLVAAGKTVAGGIISTQAVALMEGVLKAMFVTKIKIAAILVMTVSVLGGATTWTWTKISLVRANATPTASSAIEEPPKSVTKKPTELEGVWVVVSAIHSGERVKDFKVRRLVIRGNQLITETTSGKQETDLLTTNPQKDPKELNYWSRDNTSPIRCIYSLKDTALQIAFPGGEGLPRPTSLDSDQWMVVTLKKVEDEDLAQGSWFVTQAYVSKAIVGPESPDGLYQVVVSKDLISFKYNRGSRDFQYRLDAAKSPMQIDLTPKSKGEREADVKQGIYAWEGDTLKIRWIERLGSERPKDFEPGEWPQDRMFLLQREVATKPVEVNGLSGYISAPAEVSAIQKKLRARLLLTNTSKNPLRLCTLCGGQRRGVIGVKGQNAWSEEIFRPDSWNKDGPPSAEQSAKSVVTLQPGETVALPVDIVNDMYKDGDVLKILSGYEAGQEFAKKHNTWAGSLMANPVMVKVERETPVKGTKQTSDETRSAVEKLKANLDDLYLTVGVLPKGVGKFEDPKNNLYFVELYTNAGLRREPDANGSASALISKGQASQIIDQLAFDGYFERAKAPEQLVGSGSHGMIGIRAKDFHVREFLGWDIQMLIKLNVIRKQVDGEAGKALDKMLQPLEKEIGWGEAVDGVQCRLLADKLAWKKGEVPSFKLEARNQGKHELAAAQVQMAFDLKFDGSTFVCDRNLPLGPYLAFGPGSGCDIRVKLGPEWHTVKDKKPLELTAGKHTIRMVFEAGAGGGGKGVRAISNAVEIEILGEDKKGEGQGTKTKNGLWAALSVTQPIFVEGSQDFDGIFAIGFALFNDGDKTVDPEIGSSKFLVNGKELDGWINIIGNGLTDFRPLAPGEHAWFGKGMGREFKKPGVYKVQWVGKNFQSPEIVFRVVAKKAK